MSEQRKGDVSIGGFNRYVTDERSDSYPSRFMLHGDCINSGHIFDAQKMLDYLWSEGFRPTKAEECAKNTTQGSTGVTELMRGHIYFPESDGSPKEITITYKY